MGEWKGEKAEVSSMCQSPKGDKVAVGYSDGKIKLWDLSTSTYGTVFNGHSGAVTTLCFDKLSTRLFSGSKDTDIIAWDLVAETGLFR